MKPSLTMGLISLKVYLFKKYIKENLAGFYLLSRIYLDLLTFLGGGEGRWCFALWSDLLGIENILKIGRSTARVENSKDFSGF